MTQTERELLKILALAHRRLDEHGYPPAVYGMGYNAGERTELGDVLGGPSTQLLSRPLGGPPDA